MVIDTLFPAHFPALALAHFVALLSPGPDFFLLAAYALRHRLRGSIGICVGIALGNGCYILLAILGGAAIQQAPPLFIVLQLAGALYLLWVGSQLVRSSARTTALTATETHRLPSLTHQLLLGLGSSLLNPKNMLFYISLMASILGPSVTLIQQTVSGGWMFSVVLLWDIALAAVIGQQRIQQALQRYLYLIERGAGAILMLFGGYLLLGLWPG
ncbi:MULTISPECIES: LysE family translocator [unclassified Symbiopectobacterium]|uniref:LysE family translocator n=1 Tax=unclassified Symbiopectobacterium TaxID=2794573 RepID=UPI002226CF40|nr:MULTISPECIES: LysE family translocator [unclassified Symbiopectobacterium]MCW2473354.1 LysE family translocator [Candidatus Symbiopectobacterium sp. NZEC151]MCW2484507.1 LysE family translocator [Candidatus Symbiopectobacterium sp. NZEC127]